MAARDNVVEVPTKELIIERVFDAPRERVFDVFTQPEHLQKWWGPMGVGIPLANFEARPGGKIFIAERAPDGGMNFIAGVVREIERPSRVLFAIHFADADGRRVAPPAHSGLGDTWDDDIVTLVTFSAEGRRTRMTIRTVSGFTAEWGEKARFGWAEALAMPGHGAVTTVRLDERDGRTYLSLRSVYQSKEDRDAVIASGMEWGARLSYLQLDEVIASLGKAA